MRFVFHPDLDPAAVRLVTELRGVLPNGGALFATFDVIESPTDPWHVALLPFPDLTLDAFLRSPELASALPELCSEFPGLESPIWQVEDLFIAEGKLASTLYYGGPYGEFKGTPSDVRRFVDAFASALFGNGYKGEIQAVTSVSNWTPWFRGDWDNTWVWMDLPRARIWILCTTDYD
jgi:hypothetical protein